MKGLDERGVSTAVVAILILMMMIGIYAIQMGITIPNYFASKEKEHMLNVRESFLEFQRAVKNISKFETKSVHVPIATNLFYGSFVGPSVLGMLNAKVSFIDHKTVGCWLMDEGSGDNVYDETRYQNHGRRRGATWENGKFGMALHFDGSDDNVEVPDSPSLNIDNVVTIEAWICPKTSPWARIVARPNINNRGFAVGIENSNRIAIAFYPRDNVPNSRWWRTKSKVLENDKWYHIVAVLTHTENILYVDGKLEITEDFGQPIGPTGGWGTGTTLSIGSRPGGGNHFRGLIDGVRIYNRALSEEEVMARYRAGMGYHGGVEFYIKNNFYTPQKYVYEDGAVILVQDGSSTMVSIPPSLVKINHMAGENIEVRLNKMCFIDSGYVSSSWMGAVIVTNENFRSTRPDTLLFENFSFTIYSEYRDAWKSYLLWLAETYFPSENVRASVNFQNLQVTIQGKVTTPGVNDIYLKKEYVEMVPKPTISP